MPSPEPRGETAATPGAPLRLPDDVVRRAREIAEGRAVWVPPVPRNAATVVLLRNTNDGPEAFLMRRVTTMAFAAGMHVFPGGSVDGDDMRVPLASSADLLTGLDARLSTAPDGGAALLAAAARETFEECGVLLVVPRNAINADEWEPRRRSLLDGGVTFSALLTASGYEVDTAAIRPWTHWITPEVEERRYDTRFFVAALPADQQARDVGGEADRVHWLRPADALERHAAGGLAMLLPTVAVLASLLPYATAEDAVKAADARVIRPQLPRAFLDPDGSLRWSIVDGSSGEVLDVMDASADDLDATATS